MSTVREATSKFDAMIGVALHAREHGMPQQRIQVINESLIEAPADGPEAMIHRLGALSDCLLDDLAGAQCLVGASGSACVSIR